MIPVMMGIGLAATAASTVMGVVGARQDAKAQQRAAEYQASLYDHQAQVQAQNAQIVRESTQLELKKKREQIARIYGQQEAAYGAAGITFTGSPLDLMAESAANAGFELFDIRRQGGLEERSYKINQQSALQNKEMSLFKASEAKRQGTMNMLSAGIGGIARIGSQATGYATAGTPLSMKPPRGGK